MDAEVWDERYAGDDLVWSAEMYLHLPEAQRRVAFRHAAAAVAEDGVLLVVGHDITGAAMTDARDGAEARTSRVGPDLRLYRSWRTARTFRCTALMPRSAPTGACDD